MNFNFLSGYKTYIVVVVGIIVNGLFAMGYIPAADVPTINMILAFLGLATLRAAV